MMLMTAGGVFVKQAEADGNPVGDCRRMVVFAVHAFAGYQAAQFSQLI